MIDIKKLNYSSSGQWFFMATILFGVVINNNMGISAIYVGIFIYSLSSIIGYYKMQTLHIGVIELKPTASNKLKKYWFLTYLFLLSLSLYGLVYGYKNT